MRVSETLELSIPDDSLDVNRLERYLAKEIEKFRKRVFGKVLQEMEDKELAEAKGKVSCREKVPRYLFTRLGLIRFERHKVKLQQELMNLFREGKREEHHRLLKLKRLVDGPSEKLDDLLGYLEENWNGIYGSRNLKG